MARLILLNGPPGIGKSTVAELYVDDHPGVLNLDIDRVRTLIGGWRDDFAAAGAMVRPIALAMARTHLKTGRDVLMPQYLGQLQEIEKFEAVAGRCDAEFVEVVLIDSRQEAVRRFGARREGSESPWHDEVQRIVAGNGGVQLLESMYDQLIEVLRDRPRARLVQSRQHGIGETYAAVLAALETD